jgi:redox-sensitive bicupin YhaK (pirin superfamily)
MPVIETYANRETNLGPVTVARALPVRGRRLVGAWCFLDRFGPLTFDHGTPMDVAPHPHIGLQTVSWLLDGEIVHNDSLGYEALLRPGGVNVMTAGSGIAHSERTPEANSGKLNGVQLWIALPNAVRTVAPVFEQIVTVPSADVSGGTVQLFAGSWNALTLQATRYTELMGADIQVHRGSKAVFPLQEMFEHAVLLLEGDCKLFDLQLEPRNLYYIPAGASELACSSTESARILLLGGLPFSETVLMWWNFVARTPDEIAQAKEDWDHRRRFGEVAAYRGPRLEAPELGKLAVPNPIS